MWKWFRRDRRRPQITGMLVLKTETGKSRMKLHFSRQANMQEGLSGASRNERAARVSVRMRETSPSRQQFEPSLFQPLADEIDNSAHDWKVSCLIGDGD